jgi:hypothetical protein
VLVDEMDSSHILAASCARELENGLKLTGEEEQDGY